MPADYDVLAPIYSTIGMDRFASTMTPRLMDYAQRADWMGRRILDLGCGTGASIEWFTRHSYIVTGIEQSTHMLNLARKRLETASLNHDLRQEDIRQPGADLGRADLALALDVVNELNTLRDLEMMFKNVHDSLNDGKLFIFDLHTLQGLAAMGLGGDQIVYETPELTIVTQDSYDFERQLARKRYLVFQSEDGGWQHSTGTRSLRGYPAQAIATLLQRSGFIIQRVIDTDFHDFEPGASEANRIIFLAEKQ